MTFRPDPELDAALTARAEADGTSKHAVLEEALRQLLSSREQRLLDNIDHVANRDRGLLDRLAQ